MCLRSLKRALLLLPEIPVSLQRTPALGPRSVGISVKTRDLGGIGSQKARGPGINAGVSATKQLTRARRANAKKTTPRTVSLHGFTELPWTMCSKHVLQSHPFHRGASILERPCQLAQRDKTKPRKTGMAPRSSTARLAMLASCSCITFDETHQYARLGTTRRVTKKHV